MRDALKGETSLLKDITFHNRPTCGLPLLNPSLAECWLSHGTRPKVMPLITQGGFSTKFARKKKIAGYGALGKGVYFSDNFAKVSTYVNCPKCEQNTCVCKQRKSDKSSWKAIFVARVLLGRVYPDPFKI